MTASGAETAAWEEAFATPELVARRQRTYEAKLLRLGMQAPVDGRTLDVACGRGDALQVLSRLGHRRLFGADISWGANSTEYRRLIADGAQLPLAGKSFERILCVHSLHHFRSFDEIGRLLAECRRLLTDDGQLYLIDHWGSPWLRTIFRVLEWRCPVYPNIARQFGAQLREEHDAIFWWLREWKRLYQELQAAGFSIEHQSRSATFLYLRCRLSE